MKKRVVFWPWVHWLKIIDDPFKILKSHVLRSSMLFKKILIPWFQKQLYWRRLNTARGNAWYTLRRYFYQQKMLGNELLTSQVEQLNGGFIFCRHQTQSIQFLKFCRDFHHLDVFQPISLELVLCELKTKPTWNIFEIPTLKIFSHWTCLRFYCSQRQT